MSDIQSVTLDELWADVPPPRGSFDPASIAALPEPAQRYLRHAIAPGTPLASAVRLTMHGEIKLGARWHPFAAEQVIRWDRGLIWQARTKMGPLSISGSDRFIDGQGAMAWKLLGIIPVMRADGPDISRSAAARLEAESMWLPSVLLGDGISWSAEDATHPHVCIAVTGDEAELTLTVDEHGRLRESMMQRWGNPEGGDFHAAPFGAIVEAESSFDGYTIPTQLRVGWWFGTERFADEGEFWRATITSASYR